jgi:thiol:disulfide interchange protein DsbG
MKRFVCALVTGLTLVYAAHGANAAATAAGAQHEHASLFAQLEKTDAVVEGAAQSAHVVYAFFDANCLYCHLTWKALQPYEAAGLQVHWVPVAYQQPSSVGRAAAIMHAPDRVAALRRNELRYDASKFDGGIEPMASVPRAVAAQLQVNTRLMQAFGAPGTPLLVWKSTGGKVQTKVGVPRLSELPQITGLPAQPNDDPELAEFR